jgi:hypothetical protein
MSWGAIGSGARSGEGEEGVVRVAGEQALWAVFSLGLLPVAILLGCRIGRDIFGSPVSGWAAKSRWVFPEVSGQRGDDPFGFWTGLAFNIFVLLLVVATIVAATKVAFGY